MSAQRFTADDITINASLDGTSTTSTTYLGKTTSTTGKFAGADLGNGGVFDASAGKGTLTITAANATINSAGTDITSAALFYRVYQGTTNTPTYTSTSLNPSGSTNGSSVVFTYSGGSIDLLSLARSIGGGTYTVDIYYAAQYDAGGGDTGGFTDPSNGATNPFRATFTVKAPAVTPTGATTTWISTSSTDWTIPSNWNNGVPTAQSNAVIPEAVQGSTIVFPILNDLKQNYRVKNLTLQGTTASGKAQLTIQSAVLRVFGDLTQEASGLVGTVLGNINVADSTQNSTLIFAGGNQVISTGRLLVPDVIAAGSGYKYILGNLIPNNTLSFRPADAVAGVVIQTSSLKTRNDGSTYYGINTTGTPTVSLINPGGINNGVINSNAGSNETISSYVSGYLTNGGSLSDGNTQNFGNIGLDLLPNHNSTSVTVVRIIGDPLVGPTNSNGTKPNPIQRQYQITGDDNSASGSFSNSNNTVTFHYLPSAFELNGIKQKNLTMFRTTTGVSPYTAVGGALDSVNRVVVQMKLPSFPNYYYTLGDKTNPLPVRLTAFTATRSNQNVLLNWATANEQNNAGFEVQVSTDGSTFRKLAFIASQDPNSTQNQTYSYTDTEAGKTGTRYYRLRQLDVTGEETFSPVRAVSFDGASGAVALSAYPNPFADKVEFNLDATAIGAAGVAHVQLLDMTGRVVREQNLTVQNASLTLDNLSALRSGLYMARITLPDGSAKTLRIQKQ